MSFKCEDGYCFNWVGARGEEKRRRGCNRYIMIDKMKDELQKRRKITIREMLDKINDI